MKSTSFLVLSLVLASGVCQASHGLLVVADWQDNAKIQDDGLPSSSARLSKARADSNANGDNQFRYNFKAGVNGQNQVDTSGGFDVGSLLAYNPIVSTVDRYLPNTLKGVATDLNNGYGMLSSQASQSLGGAQSQYNSLSDSFMNRLGGLQSGVSNQYSNGQELAAQLYAIVQNPQQLCANFAAQTNRLMANGQLQANGAMNQASSMMNQAQTSGNGFLSNLNRFASSLGQNNNNQLGLSADASTSAGSSAANGSGSLMSKFGGGFTFGG